MEAKVFTSGNLGSDANVVTFENEKSVINFSIATNSYYTNAGGETVQKTTWHDCKKFVRQVNDKFLEKLTKGATVTILGKFSYDEFDKEVTKTKFVKIKKAYIDVVAMEIL